MKERLKEIMSDFDWKAFLAVSLFLTGVCLLVITLLAVLATRSWEPCLIVVPAIMCMGAAAGVDF